MSRNLSCRLARLVVALFGCGGPMLCAAGAQQIEQSSIHLNAERSVAQTLTGGTPQLQAQMAGGRNAVSVAVADFDRDGYADLVTGYALASGGALTLQRGNPAAVAPTGADFTAFTRGVIAPAFQSTAQTFALPVRPDFLLAADVNGDGPIDLLAGAKGDSNAYLLTGRGKGNFNAPQPIALNGTLTALTTWRQANGSSMVVAGVCGAGGCSLQLLAADGTLKATLPLPGAATSMDMARLNGGNLEDIAVAAGGEVLLFNGDSVAKGSPQVETLPVSHALTLAAGSYVYDARGLMQLAVLDGGGTLHVLARAGVDSHEYTPAEILAKRPWARRGADAETYVDPSPKPAGMPWADLEALPNVGPGDGTVPLMVRGRLTAGSGADDLAVMSGGNVTRVAHPSVLNGATRTPAPVVALDSTSGAVLSAAVARLTPDTRSSMITADGSETPKVLLPRGPGITFYVNTTTDANDTLTTANRCTNNVPSSTLQCTLRDAINLSTKSPSGPNTINVPAGTYTISQQNTFSDNDSNNANYHFDVDSNVSIVGAGASTTIINANSLDKVMSLNSSNNLGAANAYYTYNISLTGLTLENGKNTNPGADNSYGGNFDWEGKDGSLSLTNVTVTGGSVTHGDGGGMHADNFYGTTYDTVTITGCTFSNNSAYAFGGGISVDDDVQAVISGTTVSGNSLTDASSTGGGINLRIPVTSTQAQSTIGNSTITGNTNTSYEGGGIHMEYGAAISGSTITNNTAAQGGGIHFFSQTTSASVVDSTFTGNTGAIFLQSAANPALEAMSISYSRFHGNTAGTADSAHTAVSVGLSGTTASYGGQVTATNNWWGCNPTTSTTSVAGTNCDTAGTNTTGGSFSGNPYTSLNLTLSTLTPTGAASFSATGSTAQDSNGTAYTGNEDNVLSGVPAMLVITQPDSTATADNGTLSATDTITESATPDTNQLDDGAGSASVTVDGFTVTSAFTLDESDPSVSSSHSGNFYAGSTGDTYSLTVFNVGNIATSGTVTVVDTLPAGFTATAMSGTGWTCTFATATCTRSDALASLASYPSITLTVTATSTPGTYSNSVSVSGGGGLDNSNNSAADTTQVVGSPTFAEAFNPTSIAINGTSTVTFTIGNPSANPVALSGVAFTDTLPTNLKVATPNGASNTCGGTLVATAGSSSIALSGGTVAAGATCTVTVNVTSATAGSYTNTAGALTETNGPSGPTATATLTVLAPPTTVIAFGAATISYGGTTTLTYTITNPNSGAGLAGISFTNTLPAGLVVSTPNGLSGACGGAVTATAGSGTITLSGGTLTAGSNCQIVVNVTGTTAGVKNNSVTVSATTAGAGTAANASVTVSPAVAVGFKVTGLGPFTAPGAVGTATVTAVDALGGTITTYSGTVHFTSTDADATLPANYSYVAGDAGVHAFSVTLNTAGTWTVTATDTTTSSITGSETGIVVQDAIWILNGNMELERLSDAGSTLNQTSVTGTASSAGSVAFDNTGNVWVVGNANNDVYVYSHIGTTISSGFSGGGINTPTAIAIDGLGDAWIANGNGSISQLASPSGAVTPSTGYQSDTGLLKTPTGLIIDNAGSVWVTNSGNNTVTKIIGVAAPVTTPTVTGTTNNTLGVRP